MVIVPAAPISIEDPEPAAREYVVDAASFIAMMCGTDAVLNSYDGTMLGDRAECPV